MEGNSSLGFGRDVLKALKALEQTLFVTRLPITWLTVILAAVVFRWARQVWGRTTGLQALVIFAFGPNLIAHGQLNTPDVGVTAFGFIGTYLLSRCLRKATPATFVGAGLALGATIARSLTTEGDLTICRQMPTGWIRWNVGERPMKKGTPQTVSSSPRSSGSGMEHSKQHAEAFAADHPWMADVRVVLNIAGTREGPTPVIQLIHGRNVGWQRGIPRSAC